MLVGGDSLPERLGPSSSQSKASVTKRIETTRPSRFIHFENFLRFLNVSSPFRTAQPGLRTYSDIVNSGAYTRADYQPRPISRSNKIH